MYLYPEQHISYQQKHIVNPLNETETSEMKSLSQQMKCSETKLR